MKQIVIPPVDSERYRRVQRSFTDRVNSFVCAYSNIYGNFLRSRLYSSMQQKFIRYGFNPSELSFSLKCFDVVNDQASPRPYDKPDHSRFIACPIEDISVQSALHQAAHSVLGFAQRQDPSRFLAYVNPASSLHITVFHTRRMEQRAAEEVDQIAEKILLKNIASSTPTIGLTFDKVIVTDSGAIVALWYVKEGSLDRLRLKLSHAMPWAPSIQARILCHTTLARVLLVDREIGEMTHQWLLMAADAVSRELEGLSLTLERIAYVPETHYFSMEGEHEVYAFESLQPEDPVQAVVKKVRALEYMDLVWPTLFAFSCVLGFTVRAVLKRRY